MSEIRKILFYLYHHIVFSWLYDRQVNRLGTRPCYQILYRGREVYGRYSDSQAVGHALRQYWKLYAQQSGKYEVANRFLYQQSEQADYLYEHGKENLVQELEQKNRTEQMKQSNVRLRNQLIGFMIVSLLLMILIG